ncbi:MAG: T9SS type A sorting domain-containing protein [Bacteroidota bacterium]
MKSITKTIVILLLNVIFAFSTQAQQRTATQKLQIGPGAAAARLSKMTRDDVTEKMLAGEMTEAEAQNRLHRAPAESEFHAPNTRTNACAAAAIMNTPYNSNNGQRGCMFDVTANTAVTIRCFEANLYAGTTANYEIYYRAGTHVGNENNAAAWTFLGGATGLTSAGNNMATALPIPVNVTIPAGMTYSFYITNDFGGGTSYTDGTAVGNFLAADANLTVFEGVGKSYPFGLTFNVRNFNGHIFYDPAGALDAEDATLKADHQDGTVALNWELGPNAQFMAASLERSADGVDFSALASVELDVLHGRYTDTDLSTAGNYFYRLRLIDADGGQDFSNVVEVAVDAPAAFYLNSAYPNPFSNTLSLSLRNHHAETISVRLFNQLGQEVHAEALHLEEGANVTSLTLPELSKGVYFLHASGGGTTHTQRLIRQ